MCEDETHSHGRGTCWETHDGKGANARMYPDCQDRVRFDCVECGEPTTALLPPSGATNDWGREGLCVLA